MSRSKGDQRGKRTAGEIVGHGTAAVVDGRMIKRIGGEEVGSPDGKRHAKRLVSRARRQEAPGIIAAQLD
jgi:hypothetical protein